MRRLAERNDHAVGETENCWAMNDSFYRWTSKIRLSRGWRLGLRDEWLTWPSFVNRRVQFWQLWTNAAQITADNNRDNQQVKLRSLQGQTQHMNKRIESVHFMQKSNCTGDTHLHTSQLSLAIPLWVGATGWQCCYCLLTEANKTVVCSAWSKPIPVSRQSTCRWPCHKTSGRLPLHSTRPVITFPVEEHHKLQCWGTRVNNLPKVIDNLPVTTHYRTILVWTLAVHASSTGFNHR